jgi:hypothetical protein
MDVVAHVARRAHLRSVPGGQVFTRRAQKRGSSNGPKELAITNLLRGNPAVSHQKRMTVPVWVFDRPYGENARRGSVPAPSSASKTLPVRITAAVARALKPLRKSFEAACVFGQRKIHVEIRAAIIGNAGGVMTKSVAFRTIEQGKELRRPKLDLGNDRRNLMKRANPRLAHSGVAGYCASKRSDDVNAPLR